MARYGSGIQDLKNKKSRFLSCELLVFYGKANSAYVSVALLIDDVPAQCGR
jgi:hypothetical protein